MIIYVLSIQPFVINIKLFIMHFLCIKDVRPYHIKEVISQHLFGIFTKFFQYLKAHALLLDHHLCQVVPKWQSRSHIILVIDTIPTVAFAFILFILLTPTGVSLL